MIDNILKDITKPQDIKKLDKKQLESLCNQLREKIIEVVFKNGGHLSSNLGVVELTVALHYIFNSPNDNLIFDVGHQVYAHKLLTGRKDSFYTLRMEGGLSGFPNTKESVHDFFTTGHSSSSISMACGLAATKKLKNEEGKSIAIIGDGAFTGGLAYEGLNNGKQFDNLIIILNDNDMSISKSVGAIAKYLNKIRNTKKYFRVKDVVTKLLNGIPFIGKRIYSFSKAVKSVVKKSVYKNNFFEDFGYTYLGPVDGHNIQMLCSVLERAKNMKAPVFIHIKTKKGKGLEEAEKQPCQYHGLAKQNVEKADNITNGSEIVEYSSFSQCFGKTIVEMADKDEKIVAVTAAMTEGTGLSSFLTAYPDRFFDVGIAEGHAVTFSSSLSKGGLIPIFAVYSTFLQRAYDQLIHDVAIDNNHIVIAIDRAGIVGEDGVTHQGIYDLPFLNTIPNTTIYSPATYKSLKRCLENAAYKDAGIVAIRYPKGKECLDNKMIDDADFTHIKIDNSKTLLITYGNLSENLYRASMDLDCSVLIICKIKPISENCFDIMKQYKRVVVFEECRMAGSITADIITKLKSYANSPEIYAKLIDREFISHSTVERAYEKLGFSKEKMIEFVKNLN